jgi:hypothetical protein
MPPFLKASIRRTPQGAYEFGFIFIEVAVLDNRGRQVWHFRRGLGSGPACWCGVDSHGRSIEVGSYVFKLMCRDHSTYYLPFVYAA